MEEKKMTRDYNVFEMWKDYYDQTSNLLDDKVKEDFPSQGMGQVLELNLLFKKMLDETTERYLESVNIPTRNDIAALSSLIVNVDAKVDDLEDLLEAFKTRQETKVDQTSQADLQSELTNVKKDIKSLDTKLNQVLTLLNSSTKEATKEVNVNSSTTKATKDVKLNGSSEKAQPSN
jgi:polyhydroxyalkanoic acid synthase PhaR subunit